MPAPSSHASKHLVSLHGFCRTKLGLIQDFQGDWLGHSEADNWFHGIGVWAAEEQTNKCNIKTVDMYTLRVLQIPPIKDEHIMSNNDNSILSHDGITVF